MASAQEWITLARIVRPQGRRGEALADLCTDFADLFTSSGNLTLLSASGVRQAITIENYWMPTGRSAGRVVLKFTGIDTISAAEEMIRSEVQLPSEQRVQLENDTYYVSDLTGCALLQEDVLVGNVDDVHFPVDSDGRRLLEAAPLFVVRQSESHELLIPFANEFVKEIDIAGKRIVMKLPVGLLDLNA